MRRTDATRFLFFTSTLVLVACTPTEPPVAVATSAVVNCTSGPACFNVADDPSLGADDACPPTRQVTVINMVGGVVPDCPLKANWDVTNLFPPTAGDELKRYCVYEWSGAAPTPPVMAILALPGAPKADCNVVAAQAPTWAQINAPTYEEAYFAQIEREDPLPSLQLPWPTLANTKLVVVDSAINSGFPEPGIGQLEHGQVIGEIGRKLGCPNGSTSPACRVDVATVLALGLERDPLTSELETNSTDGGYLGRLTDTARAIVDAVDYAKSAPGSNNVVINLSLGWDERWGGAMGAGGWGNLPAPARAVNSAIAYAGCRGALVIVAAGNQAGGPSSSPGAALPAQWEAEPAPDAARCSKLFAPMSASTGVYQPFLYAVGGVDGRDETMLSERPGSRPRLVAPADHVAVTRSPSPHSGVLSGTSMAAAGVSAVAATVWTYLPLSSRHEVMDLVYNRAVPLNHGVDLCMGVCPAQTRRVSMCRAVRRACVVRGDCASTPDCGPPLPGQNQNATGLVFSNPAPTSTAFPSVFSSVFVESPCNMTVHTSDTNALDNPCPSRQYYSPYMLPHLVPQPIIHGCPSCGINLNLMSLYVGISKDAPAELSGAKLLVVDVFGLEEVIDLDQIPAGDIRGEFFEITDLPLASFDLLKASIEFVVDGEYSSSDPISILE